MYLGVPLFHEKVTNCTLRFVVNKFIWGATNGKRKLSLVSWDSVCQPRSIEGPLIKLIPSNENLKSNCQLNEMVTRKGVWNLELFYVWLSEGLVKRIASIPLPHPLEGPDRIVWCRNSTGALSIKSAIGHYVRILGILKMNHENLFGSFSVSETIKVSYSWARLYINTQKKDLFRMQGLYTDHHLSGYDKVLIDTDSLEVIKAIEDKQSDVTNSSLYIVNIGGHGFEYVEVYYLPIYELGGAMDSC
ncbi:hypothetical protein Gotri_002308, partial [Gossypium trilobum]|nr:hypothetical protein [Gossypium trilobum]